MDEKKQEGPTNTIKTLNYRQMVLVMHVCVYVNKLWGKSGRHTSRGVGQLSRGLEEEQKAGVTVKEKRRNQKGGGFVD